MFIESNGIPLHVQIVGDGVPIVLLHGYGVDSEIMKGFLEPIFDTYSGYQRIYIDIPGHGRSGYPHNAQTSDDILAVILGGINHILQDRSFLIGGLSYGGYLARGVAYRLPDQVKGIMLVCPMVKAYNRDLPIHQVLVEDASVPASQGFRSMAVLQTARVWERYLLEILPGVERFSKELSQTEFFKNHFGFTFEEELNRSTFSRPTLFINGRQDSAVGYRDAWDVLQCYPHASFVVLDHAGHLVEIEQSNVSTTLIEEWLERCQYHWPSEV